MDLQRHLPPPSFYLSTVKGRAPGEVKTTGKLWLFTDVPVLPESRSSTLNITPLPGQNAPYVSQGSGDGGSWAFQAKLNAWNKFLATDGSTSGREPGQSVYDEYLEIQKYIEDYGPSPLLVLHMLGREDTVVALQSFHSEMALQEDTFTYDGQTPSTIPVDMVLIEVRDYRVRFD